MPLNNKVTPCQSDPWSDMGMTWAFYDLRATKAKPMASEGRGAYYEEQATQLLESRWKGKEESS